MAAFFILPLFVPIFDNDMGGVAKRFIAGMSATAKHHPVSRFIRRSVSRFDGDIAFDEDAGTDAFFRVLYNIDGRF